MGSYAEEGRGSKPSRVESLKICLFHFHVINLLYPCRVLYYSSGQKCAKHTYLLYLFLDKLYQEALPESL